MRVKEMRLLAHDIFFKNEYLRSSKIATVQKVFVCVYIYIFPLYIYRMYVCVWTGMNDPTRRDTPLVLHDVSRRYRLSFGFSRSLCIGTWHIMVLLAQVQSHSPRPGSRRSVRPSRSLAGSSSSTRFFAHTFAFLFSKKRAL